MRYIFKIAEELSSEFECENHIRDDNDSEIIGGKSYKVYPFSDSAADEDCYRYKVDDDGYGVFENLIYLLEQDDKREYEVSIQITSRGFNANSDKYTVLVESDDSPDRHCSSLLERDFQIKQISTHKDETTGEVHYLYKTTRYLNEALEILRDKKPVFDECVEIESDVYLTEEDIQRALDSSGLQNQKQRDQLRASMLTINDATTSRARLLNRYFEGWLSERKRTTGDANIVWSSKTIDGEDMFFLDAEVSVIKDLFKKWKSTEMSERKRFVKYGKGEV